MAMKNVAALFKAIDESDDLRLSLNTCKNKSDLFLCLEQNNLSFSYEEFDEAINNIHTTCQTQEAANDLMSKANWFRFLFFSLSN